MLDLVPLPAASRPPVLPSPDAVARPDVRVIKFGGSSLATPARIRAAAAIVSEIAAAGRIVVVVSAFQGVTNALLDCARLAERDDDAAAASYRAIAARHRTAARALMSRDDGAGGDRVDSLLRELREVLRGIRLLGCCPPAALDSAASFGERLSATIVAAYLNRLRPSRFFDARDFVVTDDQFTRAAVDLTATSRAARERFAALWADDPALVTVVTGFIGRSAGGRTTTIGRNGSDYTAAIVGAALGAAAIEIWTDVDGVLTADPNTARSAVAIPQITYADAFEMSHAGARVLHPATIGPAVAKSIPISIRNTFNPSAPGTLICEARPSMTRASASVTSIDGLSVLTLQSSGRSSGRSNAERFAHALASKGVEVVLGSQACSELSMSAVVRTADAVQAIEALQQEFCFELERGLATVAEARDQAIVTVVGAAGMEGAAIAGGVFGSLARHAIAVNGFGQGTSARSVSCVLDAADQSRAVRVIHRELFETAATLPIAVFGVGQVGSALLRELAERQPRWRAKGMDVRVVAIADSRGTLCSPEGLDLTGWRDALRRAEAVQDPQSIAAAIAGMALPHGVLADCTAGTAIVDAYEAFADARCHIVTPNKRAGVLPWDRYAHLRRTLAARQRRFFDATTVGAGLPVLAVIRDLIAGGDTIRRIEGLLSGTLAYLFTAFDGRMPFSALVREAQAAGLTEPNPRDDLSGADVARKLLILARETGLALELDDVRIDSVVASDDDLHERLERARANGAVLRYVATLEDGGASARLREVPRGHALAEGAGCDNIVAITSDRYASTPLVIRGPGAGATLTAKALAADIARLLPGPSPA